jgi:hypothetical protein
MGDPLNVLMRIQGDAASAQAAAESAAAAVQGTAAAIVDANEKVTASSVQANATQEAMRKTIAASLAQQGASAEDAAKIYRQMGMAGAQAAAEIAAAFPAAATAIEAAGAAAAETGAKIDRMEGAMAYGTARAVAFAGQMGPLGYVLGTVGRASAALAPVLATLFPIAIIAISIDMIAQWVEKLEQARQKVLEQQIAAEQLAVSMDDLASSTETENEKLKSQIAKLEGIRSPNALELGLTDAANAAKKLDDQLNKAMGSLSKLFGEEATQTSFIRRIENLARGQSEASKAMFGTVQNIGLLGGEKKLMTASDFKALQTAATEAQNAQLAARLAMARAPEQGTAAFKEAQKLLEQEITQYKSLESAIESYAKTHNLTSSEAVELNAAELQAIKAQQAAEAGLDQMGLKRTLDTLEGNKAVKATADALGNIIQAEKDEVAQLAIGDNARARVIASYDAEMRKVNETVDALRRSHSLTGAEEQKANDARVLAAQIRDDKLKKIDDQEAERLAETYRREEAETQKFLNRLTERLNVENAKRIAAAQKTAEAITSGSERQRLGIIGAPKAPEGVLQTKASEASLKAASHLDAETRAVFNLHAALTDMSPVMDDFANKHQVVSTMATQFSNAMGKNIATAIIYGDSVGTALKKAAQAEIESIAARAMVWAIYETAVGFADLFVDPPAAAAAFEAAAVFGLVAGAAAAAGAAMGAGGGRRGGTSAATGTPGRAGRESGTAGPAGTFPGAPTAQGPHTIVQIQGMVSPDTLAKIMPQLSAAVNQGTRGGTITLAASSTAAIPRPAA